MQPVYRATLYAPRSVDPTEATVLTPAAGAPHSDPFVVASASGITGAQPYLALVPGRGATIDPLNKKTTIGSLTLRILDVRTIAGGDNARRWVTAFIGDGRGSNILLGRKVLVEESLDGGATWAPYFVGRIAGTELDGKLWIQFDLRDIADDLNVDVFVGTPHVSIGYAAVAQLAPLGLLRPVRTVATSTAPGTGYAGLKLAEPLRGVTKAYAGINAGQLMFINRDVKHGDQTRALITKAFVDATSSLAATDVTATSAVDTSGQRPRVMVAIAGTGDYKAYDLWLVRFNSDASGKGLSIENGVASYTNTIPQIVIAKSGQPGAAALPPDGAAIDYYIESPTSAPTAGQPLLVDDTNPVTYAADLCAGKFGRLDAGNPVRSIPFNANGIDGAKLIPYRNTFTESSKLNKELEALCLQYNWTYYVDDSGTVQLVDLRRSAIPAAGTLGTLTDADLDTPVNALQWNQDRESAVTAVLASYYPEQQIAAGELPNPSDLTQGFGSFPDIPTARLENRTAQRVLVPELGLRSADMKPNTLTVDAKGLRYLVDAQGLSTEVWPFNTKTPRVDAIRKMLTAYGDDIKGPYGRGPSYVDVTCRRASAAARATKPGTYKILTFSALPDPATNLRGGTRLGFCVSRTNDGPRIKLRFVDAGADVIALPPLLGVATISGNTVSLPVTLNAAGDPVRVAYACTDPTVLAAPAADDAAWVSGPQLTASGTATLAGLPGSARVWLRARSIPGPGTGFKLSSSWVAPVAPYIDTPIIPAPSGLTVTGATLDEERLSWTNGDASLGVEVFLAVGSTVTATDATRLGAALPPGSIRCELPFLLAGTQYTVGVRHRDLNGGHSVLATLTFVALALAPALDAPTNPNAFAGSQDPRLGLPSNDGIYGLAVAASVFPGFTEFVEELETAPGSDLYSDPATVGRVANVQGNWTIWQGVAPNDGRRRILAARHVRDGATPSPYTEGQMVLPWLPLALGLYSVTVGSLDILRVVESESTDGHSRRFTLTVGALVRSVHVHYRTVRITTEGDAWDFSEDGDLTADSDSLLILPVADGEHTVTFELPHPIREFRVTGRMVPFGAGPVFKEGTHRPLTIDAAAPAINAKLHVARTGDKASLAIDIAFGPSDGPVTVDVIEDAAAVSTIIESTTLTSPATLDATGYPALGNRQLPPGKDSISWRVRITDSAGEPWWFGPASANRDPLPNGTPTLKNYQASPTFECPFDPDTDGVRYTAHDGKRRTLDAAYLAAAGSPVAIRVGIDAFDDTTTEAPLTVDEERTGVTIEYLGGGEWIVVWRGTLHGQSSKTPTADVRTESNAARDAESVFIRPDTQVQEKLYVFYREGATDTALMWQACVSAGDPTPLKVAAGTQLGPANFFKRVDGVGSPEAKLALVPLKPDQLLRYGCMIEGVDSGIQSAWLDIVLSLQEKPYNQSFALVWDDPAGELVATAVAGTHCALETVEIANDEAFTAPIAAYGPITPGATFVRRFPLSDAQRGQIWHGRVQPNNAADGSGLDGDYQQQSVLVPALFTVQPSTSETPSQGTLTLVVSDPGSVLKPTWTNGVITTPIHFEVLSLGVKTVEAPTTRPTSGTTGTYTKVVALTEHTTTINVFAHLLDGSVQPIGSFAFDSNKIADIKDSTVANHGTTAHVTVAWDTDAQPGTSKGRYSLDNRATWTLLDLDAFGVMQFDVTRTSVVQTAIVQAVNTVDGAWGNEATVTIDSYEAVTTAATADSTVAVSANGLVGFTANVSGASIRWQISTTGYPDPATVASSGAIANATGGLVSVESAATIGFAQIPYLTYVVFSGAGATGSQVLTHYGRGAYQSYTATKTANYSPAAYVNITTSNTYSYDSGGNILNGASGGVAGSQQFGMHPLLPSGTTGVTITQASVDVYYPSMIGGATHVGMLFNRTGGSAANLASIDGSAVGWQTLTAILSENTLAHSYELIVSIGLGGSSGAAVAGAGVVAITYTSSDPKQTL